MNSSVAVKRNSDEPAVNSWDERLHRALDRYNQIEGAQPALIPALVEGLTEWAELLPFSFQDDNGCYLPVNTWGLGTEQTEIYALVDWLTLQGRDTLSDALHKKFQALYKTTQSLDNNFPKLTSQDEATEKRLVRICRRQTGQLTSFLKGLLKVAFKQRQLVHSSAPTHIEPQVLKTSRKRSHRAAHIELLEKELIEHIKAARDYAWSAIDAGKAPQLLPRPSKNELAKRANMKKWTACRCFNNPKAHQLRLLWETADGLEQILRFKKR